MRQKKRANKRETKQQHSSPESGRKRQRGKTEGKPEFELQFNKCCSCYLFHTHVTRLVFIYATRFHYWALQQLHRNPLQLYTCISISFSCFTLHTVQHNTAQHSTAQHNTTRHNFSLLYFHCRHSACVCVYAILLACVCVCRSFTTAIWLCFMLSFFCCLRFAHEYTQTRKHTLLALARAHTHGNSSSTQARNVMRRLKILFSSATTLGELQRSATGKWQLSAARVELRLRQLQVDYECVFVCVQRDKERKRERSSALFTSLRLFVFVWPALPAATKDLGNKLAVHGSAGATAD